MTSSPPIPIAIAASPGRRSYPWTGLLPRFLGLVLLYALELVALSLWLDTRVLDNQKGLASAIGTAGPLVVQSLLAFATVFAALGYYRAKPVLRDVSVQLARTPLGWPVLGCHVLLMAAFAWLSRILFSGSHAGGNTIALAWLVVGIAGSVSALFFFLPARALGTLLRHTGKAWCYGVLAATLVPVLVYGSHLLWKPVTALTFSLVSSLLRPFLPRLMAIPDQAILGTPRFNVQISPACSGLEGMGLILAFSTLWLWFFRREYRFPRALLLIPVGVCLMFLLNAVRIAVLILIGNAGAPDVAVGGFHSQAGAIAFNAVALGMAFLSSRISWITVRPARETALESVIESPPAPYLFPFLAILAAATLSRAVSGSFEWMYPLRFLAAAAAILFFRRSYNRLQWSFGWLAPVLGFVVFALWIGLDRLNPTPGANAIPAALASWSSAERFAWLAIRVVGATITVPIAEELAFRGFLLRRLISVDFESVDWRRWTVLAVCVSSLVFGLMHGERWIAGAAAGLIYAGAQKWRGRIGDAIVAHSVTNLLLAIWVLWGGHWSLW